MERNGHGNSTLPPACDMMLVSTLHRSKPSAPSPGYALRPTNPIGLSHVPTEELLLELRRRIIAPRDRRRDTWDDLDGGLDPQGD